MRSKIVLVYGGIVVILSALVFFLLRAGLADVVASEPAQRRQVEQLLRAAHDSLRLEALDSESWLGRQAKAHAVRDVYGKGTIEARRDAATAEANRLRDLAQAEGLRAPSLVLFVDVDGVGLGRNGSGLMRGERVGDAYPALLTALREGQTGSELWLSEARSERMLVSYAPVASEGRVSGGLVLGLAVNDERLARAVPLPARSSLALVGGQRLLAVATGPGARNPALASLLTGEPVQQASARATPQAVTFLPGRPAESYVGVLTFDGLSAAGLGEGSRVALVASAPASLAPSLDGLLWPVLAVGALGLVLVLVGAVVLGNYISRPIAELEEGLLLIMNGQTDVRFELEHAELGGLTSRINGLLNTMQGLPDGAEPSDTAPPS